MTQPQPSSPPTGTGRAASRPLAVAAGLLLAGLLPATAGAQGANRDPANVRAGTYMVEPYHTQAIFSVAHFGFSDFSGLFSGGSGSLRLDPEHPAASSLDVTLAPSSVLTTVPKLDAELKGPDWFDAARFPTVRFVSSSVQPQGDGRALITGQLTLHGQTHPLTLQARFIGSGFNPLDKAYTVGFEAVGLVRRSQFGVSKYVPLVGDQVRLTIAGAFEREGDLH